MLRQLCHIVDLIVLWLYKQGAWLPIELLSPGERSHEFILHVGSLWELAFLFGHYLLAINTLYMYILLDG